MRRRRPEHRDALTAATTLPQTDIGAYDPPRVSAHRPVKRWEERQGEAIANQTALLNAWQQMSESLGGLLVLTRANGPGDALGTGTLLIGPNGANQRVFPGNFQSVALCNFSPAPMTLAAAPPATQAPAVGPGVYVVPAGCYRVVPLRGNVVTVYGTPGATYDLTTYSKPRPMDFAAIGSSGTATAVAVANPAAGAQFNYAPAVPFLVNSISYTLTTDAVVANRFAGVTIGGIGPVRQTTAQPATNVVAYSWFPGAPLTATLEAIPGGPYPAGTAIASSVAAMDPGDQISAITLYLSLL